MLKKYSFLLLICLAKLGVLRGQQIPVLNHYAYNPYLYNPAWTGQSGATQLALHFKKQWVSMPQSPLTGMITLESRLKDGAFNNMGLGGMFYTDQMHIIHRMGGMASYAYHVPFDKNSEHGLGLGMSMGFFHQRLNFSQATLYTEQDAQVLGNDGKSTSFDFSLGLAYHYQALRLGFSMLQGLNNSMRFLDPTNPISIQFINTRHWIFTAAHRWYLGSTEPEAKRRWYVEPVVLGRYVAGLPFQAEFTALVGLEDLAWLGLGFRSSNIEASASALSASAGIEFNKRLRGVYTVDFGTSRSLNTSLGTQHEFTILYRFGQEGEKQKALMEKVKAQQEADKAEVEAKVQALKQELAKKDADAQAQVQNLQVKVKDLEGDKRRLAEDVAQAKADMEGLKQEMEAKKIQHKLLGEVFFANNSDVLSEEMKTNLKTILELSAKYPSKAVFYIYGNASVEGDAKANMELAVRRGSAVRRYLMEIGVQNKIYVIPMGEYNPQGADAKRTETRDRRVDLMIHQED